MRRALVVFCTCVLFALGLFLAPAEAGGYRDGGGYGPRHRPHHARNAWYSSDCCYRRIVRHLTEVRYVRIAPPHRHVHRPHYRPWREVYYAPPRPPREVYSRPRPASYVDVYVGPPRRFEGYPPGYFNRYDDGYDAYNAVDVPVKRVCVQRRTPVIDGKGGWVWGFKRVCR